MKTEHLIEKKKYHGCEVSGCKSPFYAHYEMRLLCKTHTLEMWDLVMARELRSKPR